MIKLTLLEKDVLVNGFGNNDFNEDDEESIVWANSIETNCKICKIEQVSGVVSSLVKKGIMWTKQDGHYGKIGLTEKGKEFYRNL